MDAKRTVEFVKTCTESPFPAMDDVADLFDRLEAVPYKHGARKIEGLGTVRWEDSDGELSEIRLSSLSSDGESEWDAIKKAMKGMGSSRVGLGAVL